MQQLAIPLPDQLVTDSSTLIIEAANRDVWAWLSAWPSWPLPQVVIVGAKGSGKTHMAKALSAQQRASLISPSAVIHPPLALIQSADLILIDNYEQYGEDWLFHLYNLAKEHHRQVVYFGHTTPASYSFKIHDLASRLRSLPCLEIQEPDDSLFRKLFRKELLNRGMVCGDDILEYIYRRFDRSYATIHHLVKLIDTLTLVQQRSLTLPLLKEGIGDVE
ncbi:HdaA/DnaA family protein [Candidatus Odyssella thessalonicensis]|nr:DnaA/Hda family protein [Candidatus Odyssella thessalonicensis]